MDGVRLRLRNWLRERVSVSVKVRVRVRVGHRVRAKVGAWLSSK